MTLDIKSATSQPNITSLPPVVEAVGGEAAGGVARAATITPASETMTVMMMLAQE
jgi:hypothetical protein